VIYGLGGLGLLSLILGGLLWLSDGRLDKARTKIATHEQTIATFRETNTANLATIDSLEAANAAWADQWERHAGKWDEEHARLTAELANERAARARDRAAAAAELERILANDLDAATWSAQPVPDAIGGWLCSTVAWPCASGAEGNQGSGPDGP
jgi:hypothetical protein